MSPARLVPFLCVLLACAESEPADPDAGAVGTPAAEAGSSSSDHASPASGGRSGPLVGGGGGATPEAPVAASPDAGRFDAGPGPRGIDASATPCIDADSDGFGDGCMSGPDCDDDDAEQTDACYRCDEPNEGCPCEVGTRPLFCVPPVLHVDGGTLVCSEGTRYCQDGVWSECQIVGQYTFVPSGG